MPAWKTWTLGLAVAFLVVVVPIVRYRHVYTHGKRLREVTPGYFYRSGLMTASGVEEAVSRFGIRTIVNLIDESPDPALPFGYFDMRSIKESEICRSHGVRYLHLPPDLIPRGLIPEQRPAAIDKFLEVLDDPTNYPVLIHCKAGLNRTGIMTAVYRMEYCGFTWHQALDEMRANGFGEFTSTGANDYVKEYILSYHPGVRRIQFAGK
jgi:tyrosine-protein phosphatase SIW14